MSPIPTLCSVIFILICLSVPSSSAGSSTNTLTAYQVLQQYNFPVGLLPKGVIGYNLDTSTGKFKAYLNGTCTFKIQSYELKYRSTITGIISKNKLSELVGIKVKILVLWVNIVAVTRSENDLEFSVGIASADLAGSNFHESPSCGCGFDCVNTNQIRSRVKSYRLES